MLILKNSIRKINISRTNKKRENCTLQPAISDTSIWIKGKHGSLFWRRKRKWEYTRKWKWNKSNQINFCLSLFRPLPTTLDAQAPVLKELPVQQCSEMNPSFIDCSLAAKLLDESFKGIAPLILNMLFEELQVIAIHSHYFAFSQEYRWSVQTLAWECLLWSLALPLTIYVTLGNFLICEMGIITVSVHVKISDMLHIKCFIQCLIH